MKLKVERIKEYLDHHETLDLAKAQELGVSRHELKLWSDRGLIYRLRRGLYGLREPEGEPQEVIAFLPKPCTMAGLSALEHWGYTNYIVRGVEVAVPKGTTPIRRAGVTTIVESQAAYKVGLTEIKTEWGTINIFDREKSVIDGLRFKFLDEEEKFRVLKRWQGDSKKNVSNFLKYLKLLRVRRDYFGMIQFLVADE